MSRPTRPVAVLRPAGSGEALPAGWVVEEMRWDGTTAQLAYDPARVGLVRVPPRGIDDAHRALLTDGGWERVGTATEGAELWVQDRVQAALARLERLAQSPAHATSLVVGT